MKDAQRSAGRNGCRFERIEAADEELRAVVPHIDDPRAIGADGQVIARGQIQCRRACSRDSRARRARAARAS